MANDYMAKLAADLDGMTMGGLASKGRYGDTMIAHINPQEAQMLMEEGGSGTINPMTGLPEFFDWADDSGGMSFDESSGGIDYSGGADAAEQAAAEAALYGGDIGGPTAAEQAAAQAAEEAALYVGDIGGPTFEEQEKAARDFIQFERDLFQSNKQDAFDRFQTGKLTEAEDLLLTQLNQGRTGPEAGGLFASLMAVPGVKDAVEKGYSSGLKYGSLLEDALAVREQSLANLAEQIETARLSQDEQADQERNQFFDDDTVFVEPEENIFDKILGGVKDYFTGPPERDLIEMDMAVKGAGMTFDPMSQAEKNVGLGLSYLAPNPIGPAKSLADLLAFATNSRVIGTINTPYGPFQLTEAGAIQSPSDLDLTTQVGFGNEPTITKKRKKATEKPKEEEKEEEEDKPYFPEISTATLTPSELRTLTNIYGPDSYLLNQTGLRTLV